jgi:cleavage stimulation factor subunit 3
MEGAAAARRVFHRARAAAPRDGASRDGGGAAWRVYAAAAALEFASEGDAKVARNIYELGFKAYSRCVELVLSYADFLSQRLNDATNARVLFERALAALAAPESTDDETVAADAEAAQRDVAALWDAFVAFEHAHGALGAARGVEARRAAALGDAAPGPRAAALETLSRFSVGDLVPATAELVEHFARPDRPPAQQQAQRGAAVGAAVSAAPSAQGAPPAIPPPMPPPRGAIPPPMPPAAPPPPAAPVDPLAAAGATELASFLASLPPHHAVAYLPIPNPDAVIVALMRAEPDAASGGAAVQQVLAAMHGAPPPQQQQQQQAPKRRAEEAGLGFPAPGEAVDVFRARARARGV